ncbi:magnesium/cobalt efflux protein, partial [Rhodospirillales bacterium]|nr:magnesium/cobalt efflux protein [Rhodospirillales bacterium]
MKTSDHKISTNPFKQNSLRNETWLHNLWVNLIKSIFGSRNGEDSVREAIEELIEEDGEKTSSLETEERNLLSNILCLKDRTVFDVMVPRANISALDVNASLSDLIELINTEAHSRVPIFQETLDDAIGMIHIKDV